MEGWLSQVECIVSGSAFTESWIMRTLFVLKKAPMAIAPPRTTLTRSHYQVMTANRPMHYHALADKLSKFITKQEEIPGLWNGDNPGQAEDDLQAVNRFGRSSPQR